MRALEIRVNGLLDKAAHTPSLLPAGGLDRPEPLTPLLTLAASGALSNTPVDHTKAQRPLGHIVGRLDIGTGDKREVGSPVGAKALGQVGRGPPGLGSSGFLQEVLAGLFEAALKGLGTEVLATVDQTKQRFELVQEPLAILG